MEIQTELQGKEQRGIKVPQITFIFWIIKIMATTVGETAADVLNFNLSWGLTNTTFVMLALFLTALLFQVVSPTYVPAKYWLTVLLVSVVGTLITDNLVDQFGVPLEVTTLVFAIALALTFVLWRKKEGTLDIHFITTRRREMLYWLTILLTFALGTAAGDWVSESLNVGYLLSAVLFGAIIGIITTAYVHLKFNAVLAFWAAYIVTRPLGASLGDYLTQPKAQGGLNMGTTEISLFFIVVILFLILYLSKSPKLVVSTLEKEDEHESL
ncbi:putative membrane-anchored protein [Paenibacillus shirakamiensis]|uniref:Membrane-anchored protein n=1 Tax=Paenibacillus shirakamiensis TaxID=1265935 RepID=A0ABS4JEL1_9BACL|nr:hypothetical protein [Paenibacillus shirakamiensis]MBP2000154.1 putative membrane-anchored protein [Paenibacillus shirakamiensis]